MNRLEMVELTKEHWRTQHPESYRTLVSEDRLLREANAAVDLTLQEMEVLQKTFGMSALEAWQESRGLFCLRDPMTQ